MAIFPVMASQGYSSRTGIKGEVLRVYANLGYRRYRKSNAIHRSRTLVFQNISKTAYESIVNFFVARKQVSGGSGSDHEFIIYDPDQTSVIDLTGAATTGKHTAIFLDDEINFTRSGRCRWSGEVNVLFLN